MRYVFWRTKRTADKGGPTRADSSYIGGRGDGQRTEGSYNRAAQSRF